MSVEVLSIIFSTIINIILGGTVIAFILLLSRDTTFIPEILRRTIATESTLSQLDSLIKTEISSSRNDQIAMQSVWTTADGKYSAGSFEELLQQMSSDPNGPLTQNEIDALKSIFEKMMGDDNSPDDRSEPWK